MTDIQLKLFEISDENYKLFHSKLIPNINPEDIIGVRVPVLRKFSKKFSKTPEALKFIKNLPHKFYDENNLHAFILEEIKDFDKLIAETERFLPYIDNWATCDMFSPKIFKKNPEKLLPKINSWIKDNHTYTVRFAIKLLMTFYLDEYFSPDFPKQIASIISEEYYINMMIAWYFATALYKQYDSVIGYLTEYRLSPWIHNKTIQKAIESYRIPSETKSFLKTLRIPK